MELLERIRRDARHQPMGIGALARTSRVHGRARQAVSTPRSSWSGARHAADTDPAQVVPIGMGSQTLARYDRPTPALGSYDVLLASDHTLSPPHRDHETSAGWLHRRRGVAPDDRTGR